jgi:hypothetical protein
MRFVSPHREHSIGFAGLLIPTRCIMHVEIKEEF